MFEIFAEALTQAAEVVAFAAAAGGNATVAPANTTHVVVSTTQNVAVRVGNAAVAVATDTMIPINQAFRFRCAPGDRVSVFGLGTAGNASVSYVKANPTSQGGNYAAGVNP